jgi:peroxiredoxin
MIRVNLLPALLSFLALLASGPGSGAGPDVSGETLTALPDKPPAPEFTLPDIDGRMHRLSDYRSKVVVVNFWATWCPPCREEMPAMQRAWKQVQNDDIVFLGINVGETEDEIFAFTGDYPVDFPLLMDRDSAAIQNWPIRGLPTTYVVDGEGNLAYRAIGGRAWDRPEVLDQIRALHPH